MLRKIFLIASISLSTCLLAVPDGHVQVEGKIIYKRGDVLQPLTAKLALPPRGQGELFLQLQSREDWFKADQFFYETKAGREVFYMVFPHYEEGKSFVFRGTYVRGSNLVLYYGDIFDFDKHELQDSPEGMTPELFKELHHQTRYVGAFYFTKDRTNTR